MKRTKIHKNIINFHIDSSDVIHWGHRPIFFFVYSLAANRQFFRIRFLDANRIKIVLNNFIRTTKYNTKRILNAQFFVCWYNSILLAKFLRVQMRRRACARIYIPAQNVVDHFASIQLRSIYRFLRMLMGLIFGRFLAWKMPDRNCTGQQTAFIIQFRAVLFFFISKLFLVFAEADIW